MRGQDDRQPKHADKRKRPAQDQRCGEQKRETDQKVKPKRADVGDRQNLQRENDLFDQVRIRNDVSRSGAQGIGREMKKDESDENGKRVVDRSFGGENIEMIIPDETKNRHVKGERKERVEDRPNDPQIATPMLHLDRTHGELPPKITMAEKVLQQRRL